MSLFSRVLAKFAFLPTHGSSGRKAHGLQSLSLICSGCVVRGEIEAEGSLRVEGTFIGDARVFGSLEVVKGGEIVGTELHADDVFIAGRIAARVVATGTVTIVPGGSLHGDLVCGSLSIVRGAVIHGQIKLVDAVPNESIPESYRTQSLDAQALDRSTAGVDAFA